MEDCCLSFGCLPLASNQLKQLNHSYTHNAYDGKPFHNKWHEKETNIQNGYNPVKSLIRYLYVRLEYEIHEVRLTHYDIKQTPGMWNTNERERDRATKQEKKYIFHMSTVFLCLNIAHVRCCVNIWKPYCNNANFDKNLSAITNISTTHKHTTRYLFSSKSRTKKKREKKNAVMMCPS